MRLGVLQKSGSRVDLGLPIPVVAISQMLEPGVFGIWNPVSNVVLNWQRGLAASHDVAAGLASGSWTINGVRAHKIETDHTGIFFPVSGTITVSLSINKFPGGEH